MASGPTSPGLHGTGCAQSAYVARSASQQHTFTWVLNVDSVPSHLDRSRVVRAIQQATATVARARTPCPIDDTDQASPPVAIYSGPTLRHANVTPDVECFPSSRSDGISVVSFGKLPTDVVATYKLAAALVAMPAFLVLWTALAAWRWGGAGALAALLLLPPLGLLTIRWWDAAKATAGDLRLFGRVAGREGRLQRLAADRRALVARIDAVRALVSSSA